MNSVVNNQGIKEYILNKLDTLHKNLKFTIPLTLYNDNEYSKNRRAIILLMADILENDLNFKKLSREKQNYIIINLELSCYNETIKKADEKLIYKSWENEKFIYLYQLNCNKITKNLDKYSEVGSEYLIQKIINNEIDICNIAKLSSDHLCPAKSENIKNNIKLRNGQKLNYKTSILYRCKNCGKKEVKIQEYQGRSLDEGSNLSLTCNFCNYNWVVG